MLARLTGLAAACALIGGCAIIDGLGDGDDGNFAFPDAGSDSCNSPLPIGFVDQGIGTGIFRFDTCSSDHTLDVNRACGSNSTLGRSQVFLLDVFTTSIEYDICVSPSNPGSFVIGFGQGCDDDPIGSCLNPTIGNPTCTTEILSESSTFLYWQDDDASCGLLEFEISPLMMPI